MRFHSLRVRHGGGGKKRSKKKKRKSKSRRPAVVSLFLDHPFKFLGGVLSILLGVLLLVGTVCVMLGIGNIGGPEDTIMDFIKAGGLGVTLIVAGWFWIKGKKLTEDEFGY